MSVPALANLRDSRGFASWERVDRRPLRGIEHTNVDLPPELIRADGSLDVYADVLKLFQPAYDNNRPTIRCTGWVGYIPLNDAFALEVETRVPVGNLERIIGLAAGYNPKILSKYVREFGQAEDAPASLFDMLANQVLDAFDRLWDFGLLKTYVREERIGTSPIGRFAPFPSSWRTAKAGRPTAVSSAFMRTADFGPNRVLRFAFEKLLSRYAGTGKQNDALAKRLRLAHRRLDGVSRPFHTEMTPAAIAQYVRVLPPQHDHYADALMVAQLIIHDAGVSIRNTGGVAILPSILIDMAKTFEDYIRRVLARSLNNDPQISVKDGNIGGDLGAMVRLFRPPVEVGNPKVTPDIVIEVAQRPNIIIDAKYKPAPGVPGRDDINQVVLYGARYSSRNLMVLHSERPTGRPNVELCGEVGPFRIYNGMIDLNAEDIEAEEAAFVSAIVALL